VTGGIAPPRGLRARILPGINAAAMLAVKNSLRLVISIRKAAYLDNFARRPGKRGGETVGRFFMLTI
jgi:hypothetical protein